MSAALLHNPRVTVARKALIDALDAAKPMVERSATIPVLGHVRLTLSDAGLRIQANNLDAFLEDWLDGQDRDQAFDVTIAPARPLAILRAIPDETVILESEDMKLRIHWQDGEAEFLDCLPGSDFPDFPTPPTIVRSMVSSADLERLRQVRAYASDEETRYYLNGVKLWLEGARALFVATDGHRLHALDAGDNLSRLLKSRPTASPIIPRRSVDHIVRLFGKVDKSTVIFHMSTGGNYCSHLTIKDGRRTFATKNIDGSYPYWPRIVQLNDDAAGIVFETAALRAGVRRAGAGMPKKASSTEGSMSFERATNEGAFTVSSRSIGARIAVTVPSIEVAPAWPEKFGVNSRYLKAAVDTLASAGADQVVIRSNNGVRTDGSSLADPLHLRWEGLADHEFLIIMPLRV